MDTAVKKSNKENSKPEAGPKKPGFRNVILKQKQTRPAPLRSKNNPRGDAAGDESESKPLRPADSDSSRRKTLSQAFRTEQTLRHRKLVLETQKPPSSVPPKPLLPGTYKGRVVQSKIDCFRKPASGHEKKPSESETKGETAVWSKSVAALSASARPRVQSSVMSRTKSGSDARVNMQKTVPQRQIQTKAPARIPTVSTKPPTVSTKPPTVSTKPPTVSNKPATVSTKPATVSTKPSAASTKRSTVSTKPFTFSTKPSTFSTKPSAFSTKPSAISTKPSTVSTKPSAVSTKPSAFSTKPSTVSTKPSAVSTKPSAFSTKPSTVSTKPSTVSTKPSAFSTKPSAFSTKPSTISRKPVTMSARPPTVTSFIKKKEPLKPAAAASEQKPQKSVSSTSSQYRVRVESTEERRMKKAQTCKLQLEAADEAEARPGARKGGEVETVGEAEQSEVPQRKPAFSSSPSHILNTTLDLLDDSDTEPLTEPEIRMESLVINLCERLEAMGTPSSCKSDAEAGGGGDAEVKVEEETPEYEILEEEKLREEKTLNTTGVEEEEGEKTLKEVQDEEEKKVFEEEDEEQDEEEQMDSTPADVLDACVVKYSVKTTPFLQSVKKRMAGEMVPGTPGSRRKSSIKELRFLTPVRRSSRIHRNSSRLPGMLNEHDPCVSSLAELELLDAADSNAYIYRKNPALLQHHLPDQRSEPQSTDHTCK